MKAWKIERSKEIQKKLLENKEIKSKTTILDKHVKNEEVINKQITEKTIIKDIIIQKAPCYSAESFVTKTDIKETVVFDMELHSIAIICDMYKIPLISLKMISDNLSMDKYYENIDKKEIKNLETCLDIININ